MKRYQDTDWADKQWLRDPARPIIWITVLLALGLVGLTVAAL